MKKDYKIKISEVEKKVKKAKDDLQRAKKELTKVYEESIGDLCKKIGDFYVNCTPQIKERIWTSLENIIKQCEFVSDSRFDSEKAKNLRKEAGLNIRDLAKKLGISYMTLHRYEKGEGSFYKRGEPMPKFKKYLLWLKEWEYNPYNLK